MAASSEAHDKRPLTEASRVPLVRIERLSRRFGSREVVKDFDLVLARGERVALRGSNGAGKSTILRCIAGTLVPTGGRISIGDHAAGSIEARRLTGVSFSQERSFYLRLSGRANLVLFAQLRGYSRRAALGLVTNLEQELELQEILPKRLDRCSTGMIQQLALARALVGDPAVLLLDEPARSLDEDAMTRLWAALDRRRSSLLLATHQNDDLDHCDRRIDLSA